MEKQYAEAFDNIMMLAAGADMGKFINVQAGLSSLSRQAELGDDKAVRVLNVLLQFSGLIDLLGKER